ncbi:MAG: outer membrane lipoprotein-sorting protein [Opitutaceae bacterium]|jgi:hypothetical protein|nr:outer membrane lipoprotein-sorting protein [Opitutaceae bacterium]
MRPLRRTSLPRQAFLACLFVFGAADAPAQKRPYRPPASYVALSKPDQEEGRRTLEEFRRRGVAAPYFLEFQLRELPRRGDERLASGRLWGAPGATGPVSRVELAETQTRLLVQSGAGGRVWIWRPGQAAASDDGALFAPLAGTGLTPFDLQMPFIHWDDFIYEGVVPLRGRPARQFLLYPPETALAQNPRLTGVRVYLDSQFAALVQAEMIGENNRLLRTLSVLDLKKVDGQWMIKTIELRDELARDKTRFSVKSAAVGLDLPAWIFEPGLLGDAAGPPPAERLRKVGD